LRVKRSGAW